MAGAKKIFISYRREDSADVCGRLYDWLTYRLPPEEVFKDIDSIPVGDDFVRVVGGSITQCAVMLLVIGPRWLVGAEGPSPYVRMEIELALRYQVKIIPVLVHGAQMPAAQTLAPSLRALVSLNASAVRLLDPDFGTDMERLARTLGVPTTVRPPGGSYWGITRPHYPWLSLSALITIVGAVLSTSALALVLFASGNPLNNQERSVNNTLFVPAFQLFFWAGLFTAVLYLVRALRARQWRWLLGSLLTLAPAVLLLVGASASGFIAFNGGAVRPEDAFRRLEVPLALWLGLPPVAVLAFAVFGPVGKARTTIVWAASVMLVFTLVWFPVTQPKHLMGTVTLETPAEGLVKPFSDGAEISLSWEEPLIDRDHVAAEDYQVQVLCTCAQAAVLDVTLHQGHFTSIISPSGHFTTIVSTHFTAPGPGDYDWFVNAINNTYQVQTFARGHFTLTS